MQHGRRDEPGCRHAQACLLDDVAEVRSILGALRALTAAVTIGEDTLQRADCAWRDQEERTPMTSARTRGLCEKFQRSSGALCRTEAETSA
jgi:hypothetical protein